MYNFVIKVYRNYNPIGYVTIQDGMVGVCENRKGAYISRDHAEIKSLCDCCVENCPDLAFKIVAL